MSCRGLRSLRSLACSCLSPPDSDALACVGLADVIAEDDAGRHEEPIELGRFHAVGLTEYAMPGAAVEHDVEVFYEALVRFRG